MEEQPKTTKLPIRLLYAGLALTGVSGIMVLGPLFGWFGDISIFDESSQGIFSIATVFMTLGPLLMGVGLLGWSYNIFKGGNLTIRHYFVAAVLLFFGGKALSTSFKSAFTHPIGSKKISYSAMFKYTSDTEVPADYPSDGALHFAGGKGYPSARDVNRQNGASGWSTTTWLTSSTQRAFACIAPNLVGYKDIKVVDGTEINETISLTPAKSAELIFESPDDGVYDYNLEWNYDDLKMSVKIDGKTYPVESLCIMHLRVISGKEIGKILQEYEYSFQVSKGKIFIEDDDKMVFETRFDINELSRAELLVMGFTSKESGYIGFAAKGELSFRDNDIKLTD